VGVKGAIDPGGFGIAPEAYATMLDLWLGAKIPMRVLLYLVPATRGDELADIRQWVRYVHPRTGSIRHGQPGGRSGC
jgi:hypothetical protein